MKLRMSQMDRQPIRCADRCQRRLNVSRHAEIATVNMERMGESQLMHSPGEDSDDGRRRDAILGMRRIDIESTRPELEGADAPWIHDLDRDRLGCRDHPGDIVVDHGLWRVLCEQPQQQFVVSQQAIASGVDAAHVGHLGVRSSCVTRDHGRLEAGGVAHLEVPLSGDPGSGEKCRTLGVISGELIPEKESREGHFAATDVGMQIDPTGHDHATLGVDHACIAELIGRLVGGTVHDAVSLDQQIGHDIDILGGVDQPAPADPCQHRASYFRCLAAVDSPVVRLPASGSIPGLPGRAPRPDRLDGAPSCSPNTRSVVIVILSALIL